MTRLDTASYRQPDPTEYRRQLEASVAQTSVTDVPRETSDEGSFGPGEDAQHLLSDVPQKHSGRKHTPRVHAGGNRSARYRVTKRSVDIVGAISLLAICSPLLIVICVVLTVTTRGRPFFFQTRYGLFGKPFTLYKFRTMVTNAEDLRHLVQRDGLVFKKRNCEDPRVTRIGALLRRTSLDELPQLVNVVFGQMSLVGPRPLSCEVDRFEPWQLDRFSVRPGLTCLWQVSGRSEIAFEEWMHMDLWYVNHQSLRTDAMLLLRTPAIVLSCRGAG